MFTVCGSSQDKGVIFHVTSVEQNDALDGHFRWPVLK
jgi:hypothetical protein